MATKKTTGNGKGGNKGGNKGEPAGDDKAPASAKRSAAQTKADALMALGVDAEVRFGDLAFDDNVRGIVVPEEQKALQESIRAEGLRDRLTVSKLANGKYRVHDGGSRGRALTALGFMPDTLIRVSVHPTPKNDAEAMILAGKGNMVRNDMQWPDKMRLVARVAGTVDGDDNPRTEAAIKAGVKDGRFKSHADTAAALGLSVPEVDAYLRAAKVPYAMAVELWKADAGRSICEALAKYPEKMRAPVLAHYKKHHAFPVGAPPPAQRKEGGGRKKKDGSAPEAKGGLSRVKAATTHPAKGAAAAKPSVGSAPSSTAEPRTGGPVETGDLFEHVGEGAEDTRDRGRESVTGSPDRRPLHHRTEAELSEIADHFAIPLHLARLCDSLADVWPFNDEPLNEWDDNLKGRIRRAFELYEKEEEAQKPAPIEPVIVGDETNATG